MPTVEHDLSYIDPPPEEPKSKPRSPGRTVALAALISILIHLVVVVVSAILSPPLEPFEESSRPMRAQIVTSPQLPQNPPVPKQLVATAPPKEVKRPEHADYAAEHDQSVKEQTRSRLTSALLPKISARPMVKNQSADTTKEERKVNEYGIMERSETAQSTGPKLFPSWKDQGYENAAPFNDNLKGIRDADETRLNTLQWTHATFFNRVKQAVARRWEPNKAIKKHDPRGQYVGKEERVTQVLARIDQNGQLVSIRVSKDSGVYFLDDEALKAFQDAAPFSNPPRELFASNDTFEFPFGFILSYDRGFKFDLDWRPY